MPLLTSPYPSPEKNQQTTQSDDNILENFHQTQSINIKIPRPFWNEQPSWQIHILDLVETNSQTILRRQKVIKEELFGVERRMKTRKRRRQERDYLWQECRGGWEKKREGYKRPNKSLKKRPPWTATMRVYKCLLTESQWGYWIFR